VEVGAEEDDADGIGADESEGVAGGGSGEGEWGVVGGGGGDGDVAVADGAGDGEDAALEVAVGADLRGDELAGEAAVGGADEMQPVVVGL